VSGAYRDDRYQIERAAPWHVRFLPDIESQAARLCDGHDVSDQVIADSRGAEAFHRSQQEGLLWVALSSRGEPVGFALIELTDTGVHLEEMDVHPSHGRRGVGSALVRAVCAWAKTRGLREVTLTTYRDIPWNAPLYARLGFSEIDASSMTPKLEAIVREEASRGLAPEQRVVMRYRVPGTS
jgi:GNAT superfamily N-acetyltransferase